MHATMSQPTRRQVLTAAAAAGALSVLPTAGGGLSLNSTWRLALLATANKGE